MYEVLCLFTLYLLPLHLKRKPYPAQNMFQLVQIFKIFEIFGSLGPNKHSNPLDCMIVVALVRQDKVIISLKWVSYLQLNNIININNK